MKQSVRFGVIAVAGIAPLVLAGCGGGYQYDVVPVSGTVTCNGEPVPFAALQFMPMTTEGREDGRPGKSAFAVADVFGNFTLSTYEDNDGAVVGKHKVTVAIDMLEDTDGVDRPRDDFDCIDSTVEVTIEEPTDNLQLDFSSGGAS